MKLFIISNRLPIKANRNENNELEFTRSEGGLTTGMDSLTMDVEKHWIGWPGTYTESEEEEKLISEHLEKFNFHPVFLSSDQILNYYEGYSNSTLWPLCHYFYTFIEYENLYWNTYKQVNELFARTTLNLIGPNDIVWVQDYQLMLLPQMIRKSVDNVSIGYFHHIPFPSYELFRVLPERAELLEGLLGADLIGFHTHDYMRHFVSAAERVLDIRFRFDQVLLNNRIAYVDAFPMGINFDLYYNAIQQPEVQAKVDAMRETYGKHKLILSVDRLDYSKGIVHRLRGFAQFLENHPEYREKVSLAMIVVPSRDSVDRYASLKTKIDETIGTINGKFSTINWTPVYYFYHGFPFEELVALYHMADIGLVTPLRDGMNLVAKEYLAAKREKAGVLILSEMAGAAIELNEALIINPNNIEEIENAIFTALEMPEEEQMRRLKKMQQSVSRKSVNKWANDFVNELKAINLRNENLNTERIDYQAKIKIQTEYRNSQKRLFILDYDGTLSAFKSRPEDAVPTKETYKLLNKLASDPKNKVVISSGRDRDTLEEWFGSLAIDLAAEHGACYKEHGVWVDNIGDEKPWDNEIMEIVQNFVDKTPRSKIEEKNTTLVWHYRNVDTWLASLREQQLFEALMIPCARLGLQIMRGNKIIEIKSPIHTKGSEARRLLATQNFDFIMAIGDDTTDEDTFRELPDFAYTIKVGNISEVARYSVKSQSKVLPLLDIISD
ncbi:MAG: bifunctional alpha,alpha-trehalose-phosphate synthase (UDP-forming)/trehalose-phosphatase [Paludibacter sp.]|nr:bifunctional alpha,alpha-trehalose-phosphate synthase (UDP-forming)/trehalose-phosphatase [Paludibacter sp.]MBP8023009.1 bifunctional alpha,alpha-trehalose-phosphate synthase (UDP-forming)/trehalose-phosphatase [Paludibacter sp.]MDD2994800.1 bifunctional alpha,alpha-trehalose-phosphate synthase (UDP-forming)/trehalose-phosphatase [Paludibacter sp.]MDD3489620.1 bifunctional alpha,alpha-trehalose-phosphate synthase (UDP-forming)/trehalose-phosphatase [Paludibacter sp.]